MNSRPVLTQQSPRWPIVLIGAGLLLRALIALSTFGTNDIDTWHRFGREVSQGGFAASYQRDVDLNHPPLPALFAMLCDRLAPAPDHRGYFAVLLKIPAVIADAIS